MASAPIGVAGARAIVKKIDTDNRIEDALQTSRQQSLARGKFRKPSRVRMSLSGQGTSIATVRKCRHTVSW